MAQATNAGRDVSATSQLTATSAPIIANELGVRTRPGRTVSSEFHDFKLIAHTAEGDLSLVPADARWTPIRVNYDIPPGMNIVIVARIGTDSVLTMVVYDDNLGGIQPLFASKSVITITGTLGSGRMIDIYVLPNGGWIRESVELVPYAAWEVTP